MRSKLSFCLHSGGVFLVFSGPIIIIALLAVVYLTTFPRENHEYVIDMYIHIKTDHLQTSACPSLLIFQCKLLIWNHLLASIPGWKRWNARDSICGHSLYLLMDHLGLSLLQSWLVFSCLLHISFVQLMLTLYITFTWYLKCLYLPRRKGMSENFELLYLSIHTCSCIISVITWMLETSEILNFWRFLFG